MKLNKDTFYTIKLDFDLSEDVYFISDKQALVESLSEAFSSTLFDAMPQIQNSTITITISDLTLKKTI